MKSISKMLAIILSICLPFMMSAQVKFQPSDMPNWRPYDKSGINMFETPKEDVGEFNGVEVRFGAGFTQPFQSLQHSNALDSVSLYPRLAPGFGVAQANLNIDARLAPGITLNLTTYLSSRHHNEAWVKGGYIQIDKLPFEGEFWDNLMRNLTVKAGHMEINYGDQHFRRSDGGHTLYNPFAENYIMDAFATEVAGEVYYKKNDIMAMVGISNGLINGGHQEPLLPGTTTGETYKRGASIYGKLAYDSQFTEEVRGRLALSAYHNNNDGRSTLYGGDRTGSNYFFVMEPVTANAAANAFSGRVNPGFAQQITAIQLNAFVEAYGFEFFGTYENAQGRTIQEKVANRDKRSVNQIAVEALYRFGKNENLYLGGRYNTVKGQLLTSNTNEQTVNRLAVGAGWFITNNILMKGEYVTQDYKDYPTNHALNGGNFKGVVLEAVIGF